MKKWFATVSAGLAGLLTFVFLALPVIRYNDEIKHGTTSALRFLFNGELENYVASMWMRIIIWVLMIVAVVLFVFAVMSAVENLKIVDKIPDWAHTGRIWCLIFVAILSILALVANLGIIKELTEGARQVYSSSYGLWVCAIGNTVLALIGLIMPKVLKK